jgi:hypothetical protein
VRREKCDTAKIDSLSVEGGLVQQLGEGNKRKSKSHNFSCPITPLLAKKNGSIIHFSILFFLNLSLAHSQTSFYSLFNCNASSEVVKRIQKVM